LIISSIFDSQIKPAISSEIEIAKSLKKPYLLTQIAIEMKYEYNGSNSLLFKRGDIGENFYLLIKGKVAVLVVEEKSIYLSQEEYMVYLINLRKYKEYDLLHNSINQNSGLFKFQEDFLHWIENVNSPNKVKINQDY
jgi:hypothetical protein